jgi:CRISPR/Cas system CSM-associated protein Csm5 (group 7 of RAMP superfamily)
MFPFDYMVQQHTTNESFAVSLYWNILINWKQNSKSYWTFENHLTNENVGTKSYKNILVKSKQNFWFD